MKKLGFVLAACLYLSFAAAQNSSDQLLANNNHGTNNYCAKMKDGKMMIMHDNQELTADVTLDNGVKITTAGDVIQTDGKKRMLKSGECVNSFGKVIMHKKTTAKKDNEKMPAK